jgi:hypothetical protein
MSFVGFAMPSSDRIEQIGPDQVASVANEINREASVAKDVPIEDEAMVVELVCKSAFHVRASQSVF